MGCGPSVDASAAAKPTEAPKEAAAAAPETTATTEAAAPAETKPAEDGAKPAEDAPAPTTEVPEITDPELQILGEMILKAKVVFDQMDGNGDGTITYDEMKTALGTLSDKPSAQEDNHLSSLFLQADEDSNGQIDFVEFLKVVKVTVYVSENEEVTVVTL